LRERRFNGFIWVRLLAQALNPDGFPRNRQGDYRGTAEVREALTDLRDICDLLAEQWGLGEVLWDGGKVPVPNPSSLPRCPRNIKKTLVSACRRLKEAGQDQHTANGPVAPQVSQLSIPVPAKALDGPAEPLAARAGPQQKEETTVAPALDQEAHAIALLFQRPDLSLSEIARIVGVGRQTPYKWPRFLDAAERAGKYSPKRRAAGSRPHGHKASDGTIEAYSADDEDD
jgi:hypothetical protein